MNSWRERDRDFDVNYSYIVDDKIVESELWNLNERKRTYETRKCG